MSCERREMKKKYTHTQNARKRVGTNTYAAPAVRQETIVLGPIIDVDVEQTGAHEKHPGRQINRVHQVIEH